MGADCSRSTLGRKAPAGSPGCSHRTQRRRVPGCSARLGALPGCGCGVHSCQPPAHSPAAAVSQSPRATPAGVMVPQPSATTELIPTCAAALINNSAIANYSLSSSLSFSQIPGKQRNVCIDKLAKGHGDGSETDPHQPRGSSTETGTPGCVSSLHLLSRMMSLEISSCFGFHLKYI